MAIHIKQKQKQKQKLTMDELCDRLNKEFDDVDIRITDPATKGCVAVVVFYEDKTEE
jgi:hypothetical protein